MRTIDNIARSNITRAVLVHALTDRAVMLIEKEAKLIDSIIERVYPKEVRDHMAAIIATYPDKTPFETCLSLEVCVAGPRMPVGLCNIYIDRKRPTGEINLEELLSKVCSTIGARRGQTQVLRHDRRGGPILKLEAGDPLGDRIEAYWGERNEISAELESKRGSIVGILSSIKNEAQLKAKWPEVMSLAEPFLVSPKVVMTQLPAICTAELNVALGLPAPVAETPALELENA